MDADCTLVEAGCCHHCNGATLLSTNGKHPIPKRYRRDCGDIACAAIECAPLSIFTPVCSSGQCGYRTRGPAGTVVIPP